MKLAAAVAVIAAVGVVAPARAVGPRSFEIEGPDIFRKAEMNGVAVDEDGTVYPGPVARAIAPDAGAQVWCLLRARDGSLYAGSGSDGAIFRVSGTDVKRLAETFEYEIFALAEGRGGRLYAAGAPNGTIIEISPDGSSRTLCDIPEKIVWSLLVDPDGNIFAGTGERGAIYKITPDGRASILYRVEDSHVVSLAWSKDAKIIAGTDGRGLLVEVDPVKRTGRVLYDASQPEVPRVVVAPTGEIYFAASGSSEAKRAKPEAKSDRDKGEKDDSAEPPPSPGNARVFVRALDGTVRPVWQAAEESIHTLAIDSAGRLLVGTGGPAALYRVTRNGDAELLWKPEEGQVLALLAEGSTTVAATGNPGRVYLLEPGDGSKAWIRPEPMDAANSARWGQAIWEVLPGKGTWKLVTRSGFTERPDSSWSAWSEPMGNAAGSPVTSPPARFLQCEARFVPGGEGPPAGLRRIWIPHSEPNLAPRVRDVRFSSETPQPARDAHEGATYTQDLGAGVRVQIQRAQPAPPSSTDDEPPAWVREVRSIAWDADDPNGDSLVFEVALRQVGEESFRVLARDLTTNAYAIDTSTLPDGAYEIRVTASDAPSNPPGEALQDQRFGGPFRVDHRPPVFADVSAKKTQPKLLVVEGKAHDENSPIRAFEVSWDGGAWRPMPALDGFLDSPEEQFRVEIPLDRDDEGMWVAVRATDAAGNQAVNRIWLKP